MLHSNHSQPMRWVNHTSYYKTLNYTIWCCIKLHHIQKYLYTIKSQKNIANSSVLKDLGPKTPCLILLWFLTITSLFISHTHSFSDYRLEHTDLLYYLDSSSFVKYPSLVQRTWHGHGYRYSDTLIWCKFIEKLEKLKCRYPNMYLNIYESQGPKRIHIK